MLRLLLLCLVVVAGGSASASAAVIGAAASAKNQVSGQIGALVRPLGVGSEVNAEELVTTGADSATLLRFIDHTNLSIGASSTVRLDRFVFNPDGSAANAVINISRGAMRFVTGNSNPKNFAIMTGVATIGIRGTDFVVFCDGKGTCIVVVTKGVVDVCPHPASSISSCSDGYQLDNVNNFTLIGPNGTNGPQQISGEIVARLYAIVADGSAFDVATLAPTDILAPLVKPTPTSPN
jgi:hypothetical protein